MVAQILQLKVPEAWCLCPYHRPSLADPLNFINFDISTAFPSLKPDIDVFDDLIPRRAHSRRERGWYYVIPWPPRHREEQSSRPTRMRSQEVPEELFALIWSKYSVINARGHASRGRVPITRHELALLGGINRYWAERCQRKLFAHVSLGAHEEACELLELVQAPESSIIKYLGTITIEAQSLTTSTIPWIHMLCYIFGAEERYLAEERLRSPHKPPQRVRSPTIVFALNGPGTLGRSIHRGLPPSHPPNFSLPIGTLKLTNVRFRRFADLLAVTAYMTNLRTVDCVDVHWDDEPRLSDSSGDDALFRFVAYGHPPGNISVRMDRCSGWARRAIAPFLRSKWIGRHYAFRNVEAEEINRMDELTEAVCASCRETGSQMREMGANCLDGVTDPEMPYEADFGEPVESVQIEFVRSPQWSERRCSYSLHNASVTLTFKCRRGLGRDGTVRTVRVKSIALFLPARSAQGGWNNMDWSVLNTKLLVFSSLRMLVVGFSSLDDMSHFMDRVAKAHLQSLLSRLCFAVWKPSGGKYGDGAWFRGVQNEGELTGSTNR